MNTIDEKSGKSSRNVPLGYLRTFLTLLVVAHHAALAYHPYAPPPVRSLSGSHLIWTAFPVVDVSKLPGIEVFVGVNDVFFMALMFYVSGVFAWGSLQRKGSFSFTRERVVRLGIPFAVAAALLAPLAYFPTWLTSHSARGTFWKQWLSLGVWPAGPAWFLWVLLAFGLAAAALYRVAPSFGLKAGRLTEQLSKRPVIYLAALVLVSAVVYLPMAAIFDPMKWSSFGPFFVQTSRILLYALFFAAGIGTGAFGLNRGLLQSDGKLARHWPLWIFGSLLSFVVLTGCVLTILASLGKGAKPATALLTFSNFAFVVSCATLSMACMALFVRYAKRGNAVGDSLARNAYGIYILHYACVSWLQFALLDTALPALAKFGIVLCGAIGLAWFLTAALRRIPVVARVI